VKNEAYIARYGNVTPAESRRWRPFYRAAFIASLAQIVNEENGPRDDTTVRTLQPEDDYADSED
jgi:hypothetical protein